ncbi:TrmB family transcription regulator [Natrialba magadii ATCC 43099]|uniref:TrmB family transcription regulator n=1 Tax=Natrialba magadii (strain ATCC 43099 / DSM 3394 / CCM 3739 / CIP 104546 / IAM 13178 / JCM 8861 / NBRC 102185 / NCIMB 2190 / MS3) TaxID=547559 RepID=D3SWF7_NATMM|nr:hypothetical protein [Natrialba magadii]ADD03749.1 TrmB family transcription regulator [Natrialba magadii ATCC 43099]ELY33805.1 hypothetical protein C500_01228 [Natrialba magadii ATCC 43099]
MATQQNTTEIEVTDLRPVLDLLQKPKLAEFYAVLRNGPTTIPAVLPQVSIGKTAAYDYCELLKAAGLLAEAGRENGSTVYETRDFELTIEIDGEQITVTPELARVLAERDENPEVDRFIDQYGIETLAEFLPLARAYATGSTTHRAIADSLDISRAAAFEMLGEILDILELTPESNHIHGGDVDETAAATVHDATPDESADTE